MTQTQVIYTTQAFDDLLDILTDHLDQLWEDSVVWDALNRSRIHVIDARAEYVTMAKRLLLEV